MSQRMRPAESGGDIAPEQYQKLRQEFLNSLTVDMLNQYLRQQLAGHGAGAATAEGRTGNCGIASRGMIAPRYWITVLAVRCPRLAADSASPPVRRTAVAGAERVSGGGGIHHLLFGQPDGRHFPQRLPANRDRRHPRRASPPPLPRRRRVRAITSATGFLPTARLHHRGSETRYRCRRASPDRPAAFRRPATGADDSCCRRSPCRRWRGTHAAA